MEKKYHLFIRHYPNTKDWAETLKENLVRYGVDVLLDADAVSFGKTDTVVGFEGPRQSRCALFTVPVKSIDSAWIRDVYEELKPNRLEDKHFQIIAAVLDKGVPTDNFPPDVAVVDFSEPGRYREAFSRLYGLVMGADFPGDGVRVPDIERPITVGEAEDAFFDTLCRDMENHRAVLLLEQEGRALESEKRRFLEWLKERVGKENMFVNFSSFYPDADRTDYFQRLAHKCGLVHGVINGPDSFGRAVEEQLLKDGRQVYFVFRGIENSGRERLEDLAGALRGLNHNDGFRVVILGGGKLFDLRRRGQLSYLNYTVQREWPEITEAEVWARLMSRSDGIAGNRNKRTIIKKMMLVCGGHPGLIDICGRMDDIAGVPDWKLKERLLCSVQVMLLFSPVIKDNEMREAVSRCAQRMEVGTEDEMVLNDMVGRLYWRNFMHKKDGRLEWRCELLRRAALKVTAAGEK